MCFSKLFGSSKAAKRQEEVIAEQEKIIADLKTQASENKETIRSLQNLLNKLQTPLPSPILRREISSAEIESIIRKKFPTGEIYLSEMLFKLCDIGDIEKVLDVDETNHIIYSKDFDCDDFARRLWGQFAAPEWGGYGICLIWTNAHALIMGIDTNTDVWFIEPQTDARRSDLEEWQGQEMRFCIVG